MANARNHGTSTERIVDHDLVQLLKVLRSYGLAKRIRSKLVGECPVSIRYGALQVIVIVSPTPDRTVYPITQHEFNLKCGPNN